MARERKQQVGMRVGRCSPTQLTEQAGKRPATMTAVTQGAPLSVASKQSPITFGWGMNHRPSPGHQAAPGPASSCQPSTLLPSSHTPPDQTLFETQWAAQLAVGALAPALVHALPSCVTALCLSFPI